jgi:hypothetical protein
MVEAEDSSLVDGFHGFEPALGLRWTDVTPRYRRHCSTASKVG